LRVSRRVRSAGAFGWAKNSAKTARLLQRHSLAGLWP
jgi:hypothetical protein